MLGLEGGEAGGLAGGGFTGCLLVGLEFRERRAAGFLCGGGLGGARIGDGPGFKLGSGELGLERGLTLGGGTGKLGGGSGAAGGEISLLGAGFLKLGGSLLSFQTGLLGDEAGGLGGGLRGLQFGGEAGGLRLLRGLGSGSFECGGGLGLVALINRQPEGDDQKEEDCNGDGDTAFHKCEKDLGR